MSPVSNASPMMMRDAKCQKKWELNRRALGIWRTFFKRPEDEVAIGSVCYVSYIGCRVTFE
jgi:hypothetical protein